MTISRFTLSGQLQIRGDQLVDEIYQATGLDVTDRYVFRSPETVDIGGEDIVPFRDQISDIIANHVPVDIYFPEDAERISAAAVLEASINKVSTIPGWASWTEDMAIDWLNTNITDTLNTVPDIDGLAPAVFQGNAQAINARWQDVITAQATVIMALVRMVLAMRNKLWPNLESGE